MAYGKPKRRWIRRVLLLLCLAVAAYAGWSYLAPTLTAKTVTRYTPSVAEARDISTEMSFGGTVSILHSQAVSVDSSTTVREVYVESSQAVKKNDKLLQLEDGRVLTASIDGVINQLRARAGGWAIQGMTLVQVCDLTNMQISMSVDEYDISNLAVGQACTVYILPLRMTFETQIAHINRVSAGDGTMAYYTVGIELTVPETVLPGMRASVTIPTGTAANAVALPIEAISYDEESQPFVYIQSGEDLYEKTPVTLGANDGMYVQLLSGAEAGQTVYTMETVEEAQKAFSLEDLYKRLFGEKTVINAGERSRGGGNRDIPTGGIPTGDIPTGDIPTGDLPTGDFPMGDMPTGDTPTGGAPTQAAPAAEGEGA